MLRNYLQLFFRKAMRRKAFAAINIVGLCVSFAGALLIYLYVSNELSFDQFHKNVDRIYRMYSVQADPGDKVEESGDTPFNLGPLLADSFEGVQAVTRLTPLNRYIMIRVGDVSFSQPLVFEADSSFFSVFTGNFVAGSPKALSNPHQTVITKSTAEKFFGGAEAAMDKTITVSLYGELSYTVGGVVEDYPHNSHLQFTVLFSIDYANESLHPGNWLGNWPLTYVLLEKDADPNDVRERLRQTVDKILDPVYAERTGRTYAEEKKAGGIQEYRLQPLLKVHLYSAHMGEAGNIWYVYIFIIIGVMLVCIAAFNFINLATARSAWEARTAGIRKVLGATGAQLYRQSVTESMMMNLIASVLGITITQLLLISGSEFLRQFIPNTSVNVSLCLAVVGLSLFIGLLSGLVPAQLLSAFQPTQVLRGQLSHGRKGNGLRQVLVTAQFVVSVGLIICTLVIGRQLMFMQNKALGFDKEHLLVVKNIQNLGDRKTTLKQSVSNEEFVTSSTLYYGSVGNPENFAAFTPVELIEQNRRDVIIGIPIFIADRDYLQTLGVKLLMGHNFPEGLTEDRQQIILNREALRAVGWQDRKEEDLIGKMIDVNGRRYELAGIVENYHFRSLRYRVGPMAIVSHYYQNYELFMVRVKSGATAQAVSSMEDHWKQIAPELPFEYSFVDEDLDRLYSSEQQLGWLFVAFAGMAVFVACLGLLGLAMFAAERSVKEIGIRKVLGATVISIVVRLSRNIVMLIVIAFLLATPIAWFLMDRWLENFAYRQPMDITVVLVSAVLTLAIALVTISYQATRAAMANPVESLKAE